MSSYDPEEPDEDPFAGMLHRVVIPEAADVATIFPEDVDPSREPFADCDDIDPSREPCADCGEIPPSSGSVPGVWDVS